MLPSILPLGVVPTTSAHDPVRPRPDISPVSPVHPSSGDNTIDLTYHDSDEATLLLREEQRRQHAKRRDEPEEEAGDERNADNIAAVAPLIDEAPRQGLWIDIKV